MQNGRTTPNGEAMSNTDPLLAIVQAFDGAVKRLETAADDDHAADAHFDAVLDEICDRTPVCTSDEGAFAALALAAREMQGNESSDVHDALLAAVMDYAHRRQLDA